MSVRVIARFRPPNRIEKENKSTIVVSFPECDENNIVCVQAQIMNTFVFDRCFGPGSTQEMVFEASGMLLVQSSLQGFNVTMFAFGQTGSGKTFTMEGNTEYPGVIPQMVSYLFDCIDELPEDNTKEFLVRVSYVEIYNEKIKDLLDPTGTDLKVREHKEKGVYIEGADSPYVGGPEEVMEHMEHGHMSRTVTATRMNAGSSRSHAVFMLQVEQRDQNTDNKTNAKIMLVDLAGSEKVRKTEAKGKLLREAQNINRSLTCLGLVINCLTEGKTHVPYRDSKLTRLLSDSLGGNSKTCIVVACSPCSYNVEETLSTLRFGQRCKNVKNKPKVNQVLSVAEYKKLTDKLKRTIASQKKEVSKLQKQNTALRELLSDGNLDVDEFLEDVSTKEESESVGDSTPKHQTTLSNVSIASSTNRMAGNASLASLAGKVETMQEATSNLQDEIQDLRNELVSAERERDEYRVTLEELQEKLKKNEQETDEIKTLQEQIKFYKLKVECMENEHRAESAALRSRLSKAKRPRESIAITRMRMDSEQAGEDPNLRIFRELQAAMEAEDDDDLSDVPEEIVEKIQLKEQRKWENTVSKLKKENEQLKTKEKEAGEVSRFGEMTDDEQRAEMERVVKERSKLESRLKQLGKENRKWAEKMKAVEVRQQYNDKLRRNWQAQLQQMEQALLLSNQINNQTRCKFNDTIREKELEIAKLRSYVTNQLQRQRTARTGRSRIARPVNRRHSGKIKRHSGFAVDRLRQDSKKKYNGDQAPVE